MLNTRRALNRRVKSDKDIRELDECTVIHLCHAAAKLKDSTNDWIAAAAISSRWTGMID